MGVPVRKNLYLTTAAENTQYAGHHATFIATTGAVAEHLAWHGSHGSGSDAHFLFWHRYYLRKLEDYLGVQGVDHYVPIPHWPSNLQIPAELAAGTADTTPNVNPPTWTTMQGGAETAPPFGYTSLGQFRTSAELGRSLGWSYHGEVHGAVGDVMASFESPRAPIFYPWHGYIDHIWAEWQRRAMPRPAALQYGNTGDPDAGGVRINLFVRRADGRLAERFWNGAGWSWVDTGKDVLGRPVAAVRGNVSSTAGADLRINLFVQGADRKLWERYWDGSTWSWVDTGKEVDGEPLVLIRGNVGSPEASTVRINVFVRGTDGTLWERYWNGSSWSWIDTGRKAAGDPIAITRGDVEGVDAGDVRINLFVRGTDGTLWERYWNGSGWAWVDTGKQVVDDPIAIARGALGSPGAGGVRINLWVKALDGRLWERYWNGSTWGWFDTGKGIVGRATPVVRGNTNAVGAGGVRINLFVQGTDGKLWERYWNGSGWSWIDTGKPTDGPPTVVVRGNIGDVSAAGVRINVFVPVLQTSPSGGTSPHPHYDLRLWQRYWNGAAWAWIDTGKNVRAEASAIVRGDVEDVMPDDLRINLWVAGDDARLWEYYWNGAGWAWVDTGAQVPI